MTALKSLPRHRTSIAYRSPRVVAAPAQIEADRDLMTEIERALLATGHLLFRAVTISICDGVVTLRGKVPSYYLKQLAQSAARATAGTRELRNELVVLYP